MLCKREKCIPIRIDDDEKAKLLLEDLEVHWPWILIHLIKTERLLKKNEVKDLIKQQLVIDLYDIGVTPRLICKRLKMGTDFVDKAIKAMKREWKR